MKSWKIFQIYQKRYVIVCSQALLKKTKDLQSQVTVLRKQFTVNAATKHGEGSATEEMERSAPGQRKRSLSSTTTDGHGQKFQKKNKKMRIFDFNKYNTRHVALRIAYLGWDYHGFASQESTDKTIEAYIFDALQKTRLIEDRATANYSRCGRTDKGVSAFSQVITLDLRSNLLEGCGVIKRPGGTAADRPGDKSKEIEYVQILNRVLPREIRVLAWAAVGQTLSARFDAKSRTYKYVFPKGDLDIEVMKEASQKLIGEHDFRNFCKMDVANGVVMFKRRILSASIEHLDNSDGGFQLYELTITGVAFLYHQIRCIMSILLLIGKRKEKVEIIDELFDVESNPCKPQYNMAVDYPLVLYDCSYDDIQWVYDKDNHQHNIRKFQQIWTELVMRGTIVKRMLDGMDNASFQLNENDGQSPGNYVPWCEIAEPMLIQNDYLTMGKPSQQHKPLMQRKKGESLEDRIEHYAKKRKLIVENSSDET
ncbi:tRNA pseudouridine(38/39) synthase-like isoform X2 [Anneissia japonica]|uniref:tRNA pseudouridine(38/39) synthase-like isoform X2 n=1 Tax=Anneissia japonica TaxID=1529436 RepID=UPI0014254FAB|nr:tRNA pseudouridine(38/39) synthase-like isoform X2 [Anneissia japonica]